MTDGKFLEERRMNKKKWMPLGAGFVAVFLASCGGLNTDFPAPGENAKPEEIFPADIKGLKPEYSPAGDIGGMVATYGKGKIAIRVSRLKTNNEANVAFEKAIVPAFKDFPTKVTGKINGKWRASGKDGFGKKHYAWVNHIYIFMVTGENEEMFDLAVDKFPYISKD